MVKGQYMDVYDFEGRLRSRTCRCGNVFYPQSGAECSCGGTVDRNFGNPRRSIGRASVRRRKHSRKQIDLEGDNVFDAMWRRTGK